MCRGESYEDDEIRTYKETQMLSDRSDSIKTNSIPHEWSHYVEKLFSIDEISESKDESRHSYDIERGDLLLTNPRYESDFTILLTDYTS